MAKDTDLMPVPTEPPPSPGLPELEVPIPTLFRIEKGADVGGLYFCDASEVEAYRKFMWSHLAELDRQLAEAQRTIAELRGKK